MSQNTKLVDMKIFEFLDELASDSPAPGGGSTAALVGSLAAALAEMVCNLTIEKEKYADVENELKEVLNKCKKVRNKLIELIDKDTDAFNEVMKAFKLPKETEEEKEIRKKAIQNAFKIAASVPLETAKTCFEVLHLAKIVAEKGNKNSISDAGVSALLANAGIKSAIYNVRINLSSIKDEDFVNKTKSEIKEIENKSKTLVEEIEEIVETHL
jgi:formiminotetrahydrofolate cyclodeaminase